jgi:hypothetical protein
MNATEIKSYIAAGKYEGQNVVALRKTAQGKVPNAKRLRKPELIAALVEWDTKAERATEKPSTATKTKTQSRPKPAKEQLRKDGAENKDAFRKAIAENKPAKKTAKRCQVCSKRPIDRKTQGRDSTMCGPCFDYAGWENTHSDNAHEAYRNGSNDPFYLATAIQNELNECPVCQRNDPANDKARKTSSPKAHTKTKPVKTEKGQSKAQRFAADAKELGWKVRTENDGKGLEIVTAHAAGGEWIRIQWQDNRCLNTGTTHKRPDGKIVHLRNASAARRALEA